MLHLTADEERLYIWAEGRARSQAGRDTEPGLHPFGLAAKDLGLLLAHPAPARKVSLTQLSARGRPWPSPQALACGIAPRPPEDAAPALACWTAWALPFSWRDFLGMPPDFPDGWLVGDSFRLAWDLVRLAEEHWRQGAVAPALQSAGSYLLPGFVAAGAGQGLQQEFLRIAAGLPQSFLAARPGGGATGTAFLRSLLDLAIDACAQHEGKAHGRDRPRSFPSLPKAREGFLAMLSSGQRRPIIQGRAVLGLQQELALFALARQEGGGRRPGDLIVRLEIAAEPCLRIEVQLHDAATGEATLVSWPEAVRRGYLPRAAFDWQLRAGGSIGQRLRRAGPLSELELSGEELLDFLESGARALRDQGVQIYLPRELLRRPPRLHLRLEVGERKAGLGLKALFAVDWQAMLGGTGLGLQELSRIAQAKGPLIELHGSYILVSPQEIRLAAAIARAAARGGLPLGTILELALGAEDLGSEVAAGEGSEIAGLLAPASAGALQPGQLQPTGLGCSLRPYQREGLGFLSRLVHQGLGALLADDMGLGKTVQVLALLLTCKEQGHGPSLVVAPTSVLAGWRAEALRFAPGLRLHLYHGAGRSLPEGSAQDVVLTSYGVLTRDEELRRRPWHLVVLDEAQVLKNPAARVRRAARALTAQAKVALSGTPVENRLLDLWSLADLLWPGYLGSVGAFQRRFAGPIAAGDHLQALELRRRIAPFFLRRRKEDPGVADELPPLVETKEGVYLTSEQAALYRATLDHLARRLAETGGDPAQRRGLVIAALTRLRLLTDHPALLLHETGALRPERSQKLERLLAILEQATGEGDRVLVYSQFAQFVARLRPLLEERLELPVAWLTGAMRREERERQVAQFQKAQGAAVFLLSLRAGGVGLNLQAAQRVVHLDRWWNPAVEEQATGRAHRIGQTRAVFVHTMLAYGTVEERVDELLAQKRLLRDEVVGSEVGYLAGLGDQELFDTLRLREEMP